MRITFETLDLPKGGILITAENAGERELLCFDSARAGLDAVADALGIAAEAPPQRVVAEAPPQASEAPSQPPLPPAPVVEAEAQPPVRTRRIGLSGATKRPAAPAGRAG